MVKFTENKYTIIALSDNSPLNAMILVDHLFEFSLPFHDQHRCLDPPASALILDASASTVPPPKPYNFEEVTL